MQLNQERIDAAEFDNTLEMLGEVLLEFERSRTKMTEHPLVFGMLPANVLLQQEASFKLHTTLATLGYEVIIRTVYSPHVARHLVTSMRYKQPTTEPVQFTHVTEV